MGNDASSPASCGTNPYDYPTFDDEDLPRGLRFSLKFLTEAQIRLCRRLCEKGQQHFFDGWEKMAPGARRTFCEHLESIDANLYHGGLENYIDKVRLLLDQHRSERNIWEGWSASAPVGPVLKLGREEFESAERWGCKDLGKVGFVLNASEMGTGVGFNDALVKLPVELTTNTSYLQSYIQHILAIQSRHCLSGEKLPICMLTSEETHELIRVYLIENEFFGMDPTQITLLLPDSGVPLVETYRGKIAMHPQDFSKVYTQPQGDGSLHTLMHKKGITKAWLKRGIQYAYFFEGANSLVMQALPYMLYVTKTDKLILNYLTVPRKATEAMDAVVKLTNKEKGLVGVVSVDHRQLDKFLKENHHFQGDKNDDVTGHSPFPGSTQTMLMLLESYDEILERTGGELPGSLTPPPESDKKALLEPVRVTSRIADISQVLDEEESELVGITCMESEFCFAPVKVSAVATAELRKAGLPVYTAAKAEYALYNLHRRLLRHIGCTVEDGPEETYHGLSMVMNPNLVFHPSFCLTPADYKEHFPHPEKVSITKRSTLVIRGTGTLIVSLALDGCLLIDCEEGYNAKVNGKVWNPGWEIVPASAADSSDPMVGMRGYKVDRQDKKMIEAGEGPSTCAIL